MDSMTSRGEPELRDLFLEQTFTAWNLIDSVQEPVGDRISRTTNQSLTEMLFFVSRWFFVRRRFTPTGSQAVPFPPSAVGATLSSHSQRRMMFAKNPNQMFFSDVRVSLRGSDGSVPKELLYNANVRSVAKE